MLCRVFLSGDAPAPDNARGKDQLRISPWAPDGYGSSVSQFVIGQGPLAQPAAPRVAAFVEGSHRPVNIMVPNDFSFYEPCDLLVFVRS
jgi:hypothetical protein